MPSPVSRYAIPPTRLPFINSEIATIRRGGTPFLVTATYGGAFGGVLFFFNPDTGESFRRDLPDGTPGAYVLRPGPDGWLYLGAGHGELLRYHPDEDRFESVVKGELTQLIWGGTVVGRCVVLQASPGDLMVYDIDAGQVARTFKPLDTLEPHAHYGHNVLATPDGKALVGMNVPRARLYEIDLKTLQAVHRPIAGVGDDQPIYPLTFLPDGSLLLLVEATGIARAAYPDLTNVRWLEHIPHAFGRHEDRNWVAGRYYLSSRFEQRFHRLTEDGRGFEPVADWPGRVLTTAAWEDRAFVGLTVDGQAHIWSPDDPDAFARLDLQGWGHLGPHALGFSDALDCVVGAPFINARFWKIDLATGEGADVGIGQPGAGQINLIVPDPPSRRMLLISYTQSAVMAYDPTKPYDFGVNPELLGEAKEQGQMRPTAARHDGRSVWYVTNANYGRHDGALCQWDADARALRVWRNLLDGRNPMSLQIDLDRRRLYMGSSIHPDCQSAPPIQTDACLAVFDMDRLELIRTLTPWPGAPSVFVTALLPDGDLIVTCQSKTWRWRPDDGDRMTPFATDLTRLTALDVDDRGGIWAAQDGQLLRMDVDGDHADLRVVLSDNVRYLAIDGLRLAYANAYDVVVIPLAALHAAADAGERVDVG